METVVINITEEPIEVVVNVNNLKGNSAYQVALDNGFIGTEQDWLNSLIIQVNDVDGGLIY